MIPVVRGAAVVAARPCVVRLMQSGWARQTRVVQALAILLERE